MYNNIVIKRFGILTEGSPKLSEGLKLHRRCGLCLYGGKTVEQGMLTLLK